MSDLHFGRVDERVIAPIVDAVHEASPDLTIISGDFVQEGTEREFLAAREFVEQLPSPRLMVPGNHDLPFANLLRRFRIGLGLYRKHISEELEPAWVDDEVAVIGVNTARLWPIRGGRINEAQIGRVEERLEGAPPDACRVLVTHHPFDLPDTYGGRELVGRAAMAMQRLGQSVDLLLAGHMHLSHAASTGERYGRGASAAVFVQAGTATSTRSRGEPNAFNRIRIDHQTISIERWQWRSHTSRFHYEASQSFERPRPIAPRSDALVS